MSNKQSCEDCKSNVRGYSDGYVLKDWSGKFSGDVEKFARLIIEECVRIIDPTDLRIPISEEVTLYKAIDKIYEHFRGM